MFFKEQELLSAVEKYPDIMSLEQVRLFIHISKRKAVELISSGRIQGYKTGPYTNRYNIPKKEVIRYLLTLGDKADYVLNHGHPKIAGCQLVAKANEIDSLASYYKQYFIKLPDVMTTSAVSELLGYSKHAVLKWIKEEYLEVVMVGRQYYIPKANLFSFMACDRFRLIPAKSEQHLTLERKAQNVLSG